MLTKVWGFRSTNGNLELCTWTTLRYPRRRVSLIDQNIRALGRKALIAHHVFLRNVKGRITDKGDRLARIAYIFIKPLLLFRRRIEGQLVVRVEVQGTFLRRGRRPTRVLP